MGNFIKTYGAKGLMEWQCLIRSGKTKLHISFTGGTLTEYGVSAAKYTTSNPIIQDMIERSDYFKTGKITLLRSVETKVGGSGKQLHQSAKDNAQGEKEMTVVKVSSLDDAKDYLVEHFGATSSQLLTKRSIENVAKTNGVTFKIAL